jgi:hypothetical protein
MLFFGTGHGADHDRVLDELEAIAADHITDDFRAKQVSAVIENMQTELDRFERQRRRVTNELLLLDRNYNADLAEYRRVTHEMNALWRNTETTLVDLRFEMRNLMTRDEWKAVFKALDEH